MSMRDEQCRKVCRILDDVLANKPTERDALIVAVRNAFDELLKWKRPNGTWRHYEGEITCSECGSIFFDEIMDLCDSDVPKFCPNCGAVMIEEEWRR